MARGESDGESSGSSGEESEPKGKISEYEKQRFSRIAENKARLDALGISKAAKALVAPSPISKKRRVKRNSGEQDDDYTPGNADDDDEDEEFLGNSTCKRKASASKRKVLSKKILNTSDDEYDDLDKAIALSLQDSVAGGSHSRTTPTKTMRNDKEAATLKKKKTPDLMSKMQMTQDELVLYFYQFDEAGKGFITLRDVAKMATVHDFTWTQEELQDMIRCFDMDKDGKLSLDEFRKIVSRCRLLKES
ncbi:unnamed protein product [Arabidopsis lyrata]|uniref:EF-hand domain-containing protein n=1 Tax=Arabidopsis lyrata subsp. lyrata TaxID=81972 RepID=D7M5S3_ARALL|nr:uncharacterized protein LOC9309037 [Arabidopsis lyrata subsp. lyrata]EFH49227.1 hypothetical protein ARALYDRAFT_352812 [Arabidopsis lyrata subsp. lyrata]CAH8273669.1 unnamed protein product [Arabidopsis lyrata]|eukprot:XP_002872968.1 uncharacterized protein LOC9309037 [Arabidopsis lyrata subsp. lyrata]